MIYLYFHTEKREITYEFNTGFKRLVYSEGRHLCLQTQILLNIVNKRKLFFKYISSQTHKHAHRHIIILVHMELGNIPFGIE